MDQQRLRLQVEVTGDPTRVWVAVSPQSTIRELAGQVSAQFAKRGHHHAVEELTLRGAILDPDETVGFWLKDQELLYAVDRGSSVPSTPSKSQQSAPAIPATPPPSTPNAAVAAAASVDGKPPLTVSADTRDGILVCHEVPLHQVITLKELAPQSLTLVVLGSPNSGKTSFVSSFIGGPAVESEKGAVLPTSEKKIEVDGVVHKVVIIDAPYDDVEDPTRGYFTTAHAFFFVFDVSSRATFDVLKDKLLGLMVASRGFDPTVPVTIVANKIDSSSSARVVTARETLALAQELSTLIKGSVALYEVSAKQGTNVVDAFQDTFLNVLRWRAGDKTNQEPAGGWCVTM